MLHMIIRVRVLSRTESFDLIRAVSFLPAIASIIARGTRKIPIITNLSDFYSDLYGQFGLPMPSFVSRLLKLMERFVASESDVLIVDSIDQRKQFVSLGSREERTVVIPHGIPAQTSHSDPHGGTIWDPRSVFSGVTSPKLVFYIGDVSKLDGVDILIRSIKLVANVGDQARLLIIGSGSSSYLVSLKNLISREKVSDLVRFIPSITHSQVPHVIRRCHVCVAPFRLTKTSSAAIPNKILEYLATDVPVVCTRTSTLQAMIGHGLIFFNSENPAALAESIDEALTVGLSDSELSWRASLRKVLSWERIMAKEEELLKYIVGANAPFELKRFDYIPAELVRHPKSRLPFEVAC
jgi:glycosyltransferase involved in cell wall biosynthesis